jgi:DNA-binding NtrC family response regulator
MTMMGCVGYAQSVELEGFDITVAGNVAEALKVIRSDRYDVLLSDLHMPGAANGLTVISAARHVNPKTIALLLTGFPEMDAAARAILRQSVYGLPVLLDGLQVVSSVVIGESLHTGNMGSFVHGERYSPDR